MVTSVLDLFSLEGRVAVVTGASSGLGRGFALALVQAGATVVLGARRVDGLESTRDAVRSAGGRVVVRRTDVRDPADCEALAAIALQECGRLDILVNNAGVGTAVPALKETPEQFRDVVDVNLMGAYWMSQSAARVMERGSSIINISSVLGLVKSYAPQAAYSASKAGLIGLTRDLSQQWSGRRGIRVNAIAPGYFASELTASVPAGPLQTFVQQTSTLQRLGEQHELDGVVVFLASSASSYITGATISVDGGMSGH